MAGNFTSLLILFQSYQENWKVIMKDYALEIYLEVFLSPAGLRPGNANLAGQRFTC